MTNIDYLYNEDASKRFFVRDPFINKKLNFKVIKGGIIFPHERNPDNLANWWGTGGIIDSEGKFFEESFAVRGENNPGKPTSKIKQSPETVIFLGLFAPTWGHAFTVNFKHLWFLNSDDFKKKFKNCTPVYLPFAANQKGRYITFEQRHSFKRLLEILEIDTDSLKPITEPTQFKNIILPDESFIIDKHLKISFTTEYRESIDRVRNFALKNRTPTSNKKVYYHYGRHQFGEERLAEYFKSKGYAIVSPEKLPLDEQLNVLINADSFASTLGSCAHNSVFLRDATEVILIPRANNFTGYQQAVDRVHEVRTNYIDSTLSIFGDIHGPNCFIISKQIKSFFGDKFDGYSTDDFKTFLKYVEFCMNKEHTLHSRAAARYGKVLPDFLSQLLKHGDLIKTYKLPTDWEKKLL